MDPRDDCNQVLDQLGEYLDQDAKDELCRAIEQHLKGCKNCRIEVDKIKKTIVLYQADVAIDLPIQVASRLSAAMAHAYEPAPKSGASD